MPSRHYGVISTQYLMENTPVRKLMELNSSIDSISWNVRLPNAFEKQDYRGEVALPPCDSARFVLTGVTGVDESQHGLKIEVDENKFSITGTPRSFGTPQGRTACAV